MKGVPAGMYFPGSSIIHRLSAEAKLLCFIALVAAAVCTSTPPGFAVLAAGTAAAALLSRLPLSALLGSVRRLLWFFITIFLMNTCFFASEAVWAEWWIFHPSAAGMLQGAVIVLRVLLVLVMSTVLTGTTAPMETTAALERLMSPLRYIGVPTAMVAMIISVAVQFIPTLFEETDMLRKAQTARGARFDSRRLTDRAADVMPLVIPIFISAFRRADELSVAMEARGYRAKRGGYKLSPVRFTAKDALALSLCLALCAAQIIVFN